MPEVDHHDQDPDSSTVPPEIDTTRPSIARVYDASLGGKDNFEVDRAVLRNILAIDATGLIMPRDNRAWLVRITRFLAVEAGIRQFLDCGSGLPTAENTHQVAQRFSPEATVLYVDNDPVVLAHGRALLEDNEQTHFVPADLTEPDEVLGHPDVRSRLDFGEPIALYQVGTLHHFPDTDKVRALMRRYVDALPSGSYVAISHFYRPEDPELAARAEQLERIFVDGPLGSGYFRTREEIGSMFAGLDLVEPGLTLAPDWWPDGPRLKPLITPQKLFLVGLARKP